MAVLPPNVMPLLENDSLVEPDTPFSRLMTTAAGTSQSELQWLLRSFEALPIPALCRTDLYDALDVQLRWKLEHSKASRTLDRREADRLFCRDRPLLRRSDISLAEELASVPLPLRKLGREAGSEMLDFVRDALAVRYRELHGTTNGAAEHIHEAAPGRGTRMYIWGLTPEWRLPLRAYYAGFTVKNGVPINYFEAIGLFEWLEVVQHLLCFSRGRDRLDLLQDSPLAEPGFGSDVFLCLSLPARAGELGSDCLGRLLVLSQARLSPGRPDLLRITQDEEAAMRRNPKHRTSARTLRTLATGHMFSEFGSRAPGAWDTFSTRNVVLALQRHMAQKFGGDAGRMRAHTSQSLAETVGVNIHRWNELEKQAFWNFALCSVAAAGGEQLDEHTEKTTRHNHPS